MEPCLEVGREIFQKVCQRFSNKGQYTSLGDSLIGECCNLVIRTSNSNLILNYPTVKYGILISKKFINVELKFLAPTMGHHSKFSIAF